MICIFEVFSQNRQEDDFLENLALIAQIIKEQEQQNNSVEEVTGQIYDPPIEIAKPETVHPFLLEVETLGAERLIDEQMERWLRERHDEKNKMLNSVFKTFRQTGDRPDFVNSLNRLYRKHQIASVARTIDVQPVQERDPFIVEVETLAEKFGKFTQAEVEFVKRLYEQKDRKLMLVYNTFLQSYDRDDFVNSIKLLFKRNNKQA